MIGNKSDLGENKNVETETAKQYGNNKKMEFFEASAKTSDQVNNAFLSLARKLMTKTDS